MSTSSWGIFDQWRKGLLGFGDPTKEGASTTFDDEWRKKKLRRGQTESSNLSTAGGVEPTGNIIPRRHLKRGESSGTGIPSHMDPNYIPRNRIGKEYPQASAQDIKEGKTIQLASGKHVVVPGASARVLASKNPNVAHVSKSGQVTYKQDASKTPNLAKGNNKVYQDAIMRGGKGANVPQDLNWWQKLSGMFNSKFDMDGAMASWKEKGGFEGLMANPAFTMGLAFMQAGAEGKTIGQGALDNVMKAGGISSYYKKMLKDREEAPIEVTATDIGEVKSLLQSMDISGPSKVEKFFGFLGGKKNMEFKWDLASEEIAVELQKEINKLKKNKKPGAPEVVYDTTKKLQILKRMFEEGRFKKKGGTWFTDATLQTTQEIPTLDSKPKINKNNPLEGYVGFAQGGQIQKGQPAIVGEEGPEYFLPQESGNVLSNDDSQIFAMLLASNPQLQNVSKQRAERILRSRFPEYFEG